MRRTAILALMLGLLAGCDPGAQVPVIGFDQNGEPAQVMIPVADYTARFSGLVSAVRDSAIPALARRDEAARSSEGGSWMLRTAIVGVGANAEIGIGKAFKIGATPRFRLVFSNSSDPVLP